MCLLASRRATFPIVQADAPEKTQRHKQMRLKLCHVCADSYSCQTGLRMSSKENLTSLFQCKALIVLPCAWLRDKWSASQFSSPGVCLMATCRRGHNAYGAMWTAQQMQQHNKSKQLTTPSQGGETAYLVAQTMCPVRQGL